MKRIPPYCTLLLAIAQAAGGQSGHVEMSDALRSWAAGIERISGGTVIAARIYTDPLRNTMRVPEDVPRPEILARYMKDAGFRAQLAAAHALSLNYDGPGGRLHYILLNMALADQWAGQEEALLGHELGHAWLNARGYRSPAFLSGARACIPVLTGDIVQHILIRSEMDRRGIPYREFMARQLEADAPDPDPVPCRRLILLTHLLDARLGLDRTAWRGLDSLERRMENASPLLLPYAEAIERYLQKTDVAHPARFAEALGFIGAHLERLYEALPYRPAEGLDSSPQVSENKEENHIFH